jgi:glycosyltransferase involved in cell wall biosynthesis
VYKAIKRIIGSLSLNLFLFVAAEKPMVIVIPSYNNQQWCRQNLASTIQNYENYRIIYIDDCSCDKTAQEVEAFLQDYPAHAKRITFIKNSERKGALANLYYAIYSCTDEEIIVTLDGDDFLAHPQVLATLNAAYADTAVWLTYGQLTTWPHTINHFKAKEIPAHYVQAPNGLRQWPYAATHIRTFYAGLFKKIALKDLLYEGQFYQMAWDIAMMTPMVEMARERHKCLADILYVYNTNNPLSDHNVNRQLQLTLHTHIQQQPPYERLEKLF